MAEDRNKDEGLDKLEEEVSREEGIKNIGPNMTTREAGKLGGGMVRKLVEEGKEATAEKGEGFEK